MLKKYTFFTKIIVCCFFILNNTRLLVGMVPYATPPMNLDDAFPLHYAARNGDLEAVKRLVSAGVDLNSLDHRGNTPLCAAVRGKHAAIVVYLLEQGADIDAPGFFKMSPLATAVVEQDAEMVRFLAEHGARVDLRDAGNYTPLFRAINSGCEDIIEILLRHGADTTVPGFWYVPSLLAYAREYGFGQALKLLKRHGVDLYTTLREWRTVRERDDVQNEAEVATNVSIAPATCQ